MALTAEDLSGHRLGPSVIRIRDPKTAPLRSPSNAAGMRSAFGRTSKSGLRNTSSTNRALDATQSLSGSSRYSPPSVTAHRGAKKLWGLLPHLHPVVALHFEELEGSHGGSAAACPLLSEFL